MEIQFSESRALMSRLCAVTVFAAAAFFSLSAVSFGSVDLKLTKTAPASIRAGERITFVIAVHNDSSFQAESIQVTDELPEQTRGNVTLEGGGLECFQEGSTVSCSGDFLPAGDIRTIRVSADVSAGAAQQILNTARVQTSSPELNPADNEASSVTAVEPETPDPANLSLTATGTPESVRPRSLVTYTIQAINHGSATGLNTILTGELAAGLEFLSAESPQGPCVQEGNLVTCDLGDLVSGGAAQAIVNVRTMNTIGTFTSRFFCMPQNPDADEGDNDAEVPTRVDARAPFSFSCCETAIALDLRHGSIKEGLLPVIVDTETVRPDGRPGPYDSFDAPGTRTLALEIKVPISWECHNLAGAACVGSFDVEILEEPKQAGADGAFTVSASSTALRKNFKRRRCVAGRKFYAVIRVVYNASYPTNGPVEGTFRIKIKVPSEKGTLDHVISTRLTTVAPTKFTETVIEDTNGRID